MRPETVSEACTECAAPLGADHMSWCDKNGGKAVEHADCRYPYIKRLDDGRRVVVDRFDDRVVAYEVGPVDWKTTVLLNPTMTDKLSGALGSLLDKLMKGPR